jgi:hypothetical protein
MEDGQEHNFAEKEEEALLFALEAGIKSLVADAYAAGLPLGPTREAVIRAYDDAAAELI